MMNWDKLVELIMKLTPEERKKDVVVVVREDPYSTEQTNLLINKNNYDCKGFGDGDPYLEIVGAPLEDILREEPDDTNN